MHKFFICEDGPMGGVSIVAVASTESVALAMWQRRREKSPTTNVVLFVNTLESDDWDEDIRFEKLSG